MTRKYDDPSWATLAVNPITNLQGMMKDGYAIGEEPTGDGENYVKNLMGEIAKFQSGSVIYTDMNDFCANAELNEHGVIDDHKGTIKFGDVDPANISTTAYDQTDYICTDGEFVFCVETDVGVETALTAYKSNDLSIRLNSIVLVTDFFTIHGVACNGKYIAVYGDEINDYGQIELYEYDGESNSFSRIWVWNLSIQDATVYSLTMSATGLYYGCPLYQQIGRISYAQSSSSIDEADSDWTEGWQNVRSVDCGGGYVVFGGDHNDVGGTDSNVVVYNDSPTKTEVQRFEFHNPEFHASDANCYHVFCDDKYLYALMDDDSFSGTVTDVFVRSLADFTTGDIVANGFTPLSKHDGNAGSVFQLAMTGGFVDEDYFVMINTGSVKYFDKKTMQIVSEKSFATLNQMCSTGTSFIVTYDTDKIAIANKAIIKKFKKVGSEFLTSAHHRLAVEVG